MVSPATASLTQQGLRTGLSAGFDYKINKNLLVGINGGYSETDVDYIAKVKLVLLNFSFINL